MNVSLVGASTCAPAGYSLKKAAAFASMARRKNRGLARRASGVGDGRRLGHRPRGGRALYRRRRACRGSRPGARPGRRAASEFGDAVVAVTGDVAQLADNKRAVAETVAAFGRLDIFVGNAGVFDNFLSLAEFPEETLVRGL